jgi:hypothetical protein
MFEQFSTAANLINDESRRNSGKRVENYEIILCGHKGIFRFRFSTGKLLEILLVLIKILMHLL